MQVIPFLKTFLILIVFSLFFLILDQLKLLSLPKQALGFLTTPIQYGLYSSGQGFGRQFYFIFGARTASQENKAMQDQIAQILSENANLRRKLAETESLLSQERSLDPQTYNLITTRPIGFDRYLKVDKGTKSGVKKDMAAVFKDNYLGQVISVSENGAEIRLVSDPDSKIGSFSLNKDGRAKGVLNGHFGSQMLMDKIFHEEKIEKGDLVYSEGTEEFLPRGLILGRVVKVLSEDNQLFKQAEVEPVFDIRDLELVFLINN